MVHKFDIHNEGCVIHMQEWKAALLPITDLLIDETFDLLKPADIVLHLSAYTAKAIQSQGK